VSVPGRAFVVGVPSSRRRNKTFRQEAITMTQYLLSVWHDDTYELDFSTPDACEQPVEVRPFQGV